MRHEIDVVLMRTCPACLSNNCWVQIAMHHSQRDKLHHGGLSNEVESHMEMFEILGISRERVVAMKQVGRHVLGDGSCCCRVYWRTYVHWSVYMQTPQPTKKSW